MNNPARISGRAVIASTTVLTSRDARPPTSDMYRGPDAEGQRNPDCYCNLDHGPYDCVQHAALVERCGQADCRHVVSEKVRVDKGMPALGEGVDDRACERAVKATTAAAT